MCALQLFYKCRFWFNGWPGFMPWPFINSFKNLFYEQLKELIKNPATVVVDVRSPLEYEAEHIPGAKIFRWKK